MEFFEAYHSKLRYRASKNWRTRLQPIRTASEITAQIKIHPVQNIPLYQKHADKIAQLRRLGMTQKEIAKSLNISIKTVKKACKFERKEK